MTGGSQRPMTVIRGMFSSFRRKSTPEVKDEHCLLLYNFCQYAGGRIVSRSPETADFQILGHQWYCRDAREGNCPVIPKMSKHGTKKRGSKTLMTALIPRYLTGCLTDCQMALIRHSAENWTPGSARPSGARLKTTPHLDTRRGSR